MCEFKIGQEVVCIDNNAVESALSEGKIYTIRALAQGHCNNTLVDVGVESYGTCRRCSVCGTGGLPKPFNNHAFCSSRFAPLQDISELQEILKVKQEITNL